MLHSVYFTRKIGFISAYVLLSLVSGNGKSGAVVPDPFPKEENQGVHPQALKRSAPNSQGEPSPKHQKIEIDDDLESGTGFTYDRLLPALEGETYYGTHWQVIFY